MKGIAAAALTMMLLATAPAAAEDDAEGCKDHPMFTRMSNMYLYSCGENQFDLRKFPVGPAPESTDQPVKSVDIEGPVQWMTYATNDGAKPASGLQIMRNFENAAKKAGGTIEGQYPGWCKAMYDTEGMPNMGNGCMSYGLTLKFVRGGRETWLFLQASGDEGTYSITVSEREAMKQDIAVNELADKLSKDGFVTLSVNFDTGKATIRPDSAKLLDDAAGALNVAKDLRVEVGGHTDNVGSADANLKLSQQRAQAVMAALVERGIDAGRMTAKGYGQTVPIADNRTEDGRAKNRRVELVKQ